jgi:hypothetical protein
MEEIVEESNETQTPCIKKEKLNYSPYSLEGHTDDDDDEDTPTLKQKVESKRRLEVGKSEMKLKAK